MSVFSNLVGAANWKYAIGEVLLIFVGIMLALAANSWYENRSERQDEKEILIQLKSALSVDESNLESNLLILRQMEKDVELLVSRMDSDEPFTEELIPSFRSLNRWISVRSMTAPYEALKSRGLNLISDSDLQLKVIFYYESQFPLVTGAYLNNREFVRSQVIPFLAENFRLKQDWVPSDYDALRTDDYFRNLCMLKLRRLSGRQLPYYEETLVQIGRLKAMIDEQLSRL